MRNLFRALAALFVCLVGARAEAACTGNAYPFTNSTLTADCLNAAIAAAHDLTSATGVLAPSQGGSGVANSGTVTLGGNLVTGGALTFADLPTISQLLYTDSARHVTGLATANNGLLVTDGSGVPSISTTLPSATTPGTSAIAPHVATNAALAAASTATYPNGVWRDDYAAGNGAPPLFFVVQTGTCGANSMVNDGGSCVNSSDSNSWKAVPADSSVNVRQFGAVGNGVQSNGITTTSGSVAIGGVTFSASQIGQTSKISGVGASGDPLVTTIASATTLGAPASITSSAGAPSYFVNSFLVPNPGTGYTVGDVLTATAPTAGTATATAQFTVDAVNAGVVTALRVSRPGSYTASSPWSGASISPTGGTGSGLSITPAMLTAGYYFTAADDSAAINNAISAAISQKKSRVYFPTANSYYGICASAINYSTSNVETTVLSGDGAWIKVIPGCATPPTKVLNFTRNFPTNYGQSFQNGTLINGLIFDGSHLTKYVGYLSGNSFAIHNTVFENPAPATSIADSAIVYGNGNIELVLGSSNWLIAVNNPADVYYTGIGSLPTYGLYESGGNNNFTGLIVIGAKTGIYSLNGDNYFGPGTHIWGGNDYAQPSVTTTNPSIRPDIGLHIVGRGYANSVEIDDAITAGIFAEHTDVNDQIEVDGTNCVYTGTPASTQKCVKIGAGVQGSTFTHTYGAQLQSIGSPGNIVAPDGALGTGTIISDNPNATKYAVTTVSPVFFANNGTGLAAGTYYFGPTGSFGFATSWGWVVPGSGCRISNVVVDFDATPDAGKTFTVSLFDNAASTGITTTVSNGAFSANLLSASTYAAAAGHTINIQIINETGNTSAPNVRAVMSWACDFAQ